MQALIVVDMQNDFMDEGALAVPGSLEIIDTVNTLMASPAFNRVVATQDWHPANHGSFASNHEGKVPGDVIELNGLEQILWPDHCVQGTEGAEFVDGLDTNRFDKVFQKGTNPEVDSYSGFYDNGHREDTGLADYLRSEGITSVCICGVATDYCVKFTVLDACEEEFETDLVWDATEGVEMNEGDIGIALAQMLDAGASVVKAKLVVG